MVKAVIREETTCANIYIYEVPTHLHISAIGLDDECAERCWALPMRSLCGFTASSHYSHGTVVGWSCNFQS